MLCSGVCGTRCESSNCLLAQEEENRRDSDRQVARHVLLCLLLLVSLLAVSKPLWSSPSLGLSLSLSVSLYLPLFLSLTFSPYPSLPRSLSLFV